MQKYMVFRYDVDTDDDDDDDDDACYVEGYDNRS